MFLHSNSVQNQFMPYVTFMVLFARCGLLYLNAVNTDVVEVTLGGVNNPNEDGSCHYFDVDEFQVLNNKIC